MEKYCKSCGRVFKDSDFKLCPYCGNQLSTREGRQPIPRKLRHQVFQRDNYRCRECGATNKQTRLHVDHIVPVAKGGTNDLNNLQTLCEECNMAKYTDEWIGGLSRDDVILESSVLPGIPLRDFKHESEETIFKNNLESYGFRLIKSDRVLKKCPICKTILNEDASYCDECNHKLSEDDIHISKYGRTTIRNSNEFADNLFENGVILLCSIPDYDKNYHIKSPLIKETPMIIRFSYDILYMEKIDSSFNLEIPWLELNNIKIKDNKLIVSFDNKDILVNLPKNFNVVDIIKRIILEKTEYAFDIDNKLVNNTSQITINMASNSDMMYCRFCGGIIPANSKFCSICGEKL